MEEAIEKLKVESKPTIKKVNLEKVDKAFGAMYSDFDHEVQAHPGFFAPAPKSRPIKPKPVVGPVKKRKRSACDSILPTRIALLVASLLAHTTHCYD